MERDRMRRETLDDDTLSLFCSQLSLMLQAGIGVEEGAALLAGDADEPGQRTLLAGLRAGLDRGEPLSQALEATGGFPDYLLRMVEIGQASGRLDQVLAALGRYYARQADTRRALRRAVAYPAVMAVLIAVIFLVLVARVLPVFQQVFVQLGVELSPVAAALLRFGSAGQAVTAAAAVVLALCALLLVWLLRAQTGAAALSGLFARTRAARALGRSWFASAMAMMLSSGVPLDEAMERTAGLLAGSPLAAPLADCRARMEQGEPFRKAVEQAGVLSGLSAGLLSAGERAGRTDQAMEELSQRCRQEADQALEQLLGRFEYALVAALCAAVALVLLSVMLPLLGVLSAVGG
ncbi:type II secretion system F family protein [Lawsonibacter hominis]|uniref:Type II secretion system F family protein n=2 Tax=Lawsonibacter TaxID=2172004 RepID=A0A8J6JDR1_9FIRM|nr:type II secretion system F family protein [Lawsonibacter hominis]MBC5732809.1 type II secretion system F family protein [Lawsonibacter hominis]